MLCLMKTVRIVSCARISESIVSSKSSSLSANSILSLSLYGGDEYWWMTPWDNEEFLQLCQLSDRANQQSFDSCSINSADISAGNPHLGAWLQSQGRPVRSCPSLSQIARVHEAIPCVDTCQTHLQPLCVPRNTWQKYCSLWNRICIGKTSRDAGSRPQDHC
jgi:hypothetical protein